MSIREEFGRVGFTLEEKTDLTARLMRAAEQEENMTASTKRKIKKISGGMVFGIAAACLMTVGALAAVLSPGLKDYFDAPGPGAQEALESGIYRLDRSETCNGWTVTLAECIGDDDKLCIWVDLTAPEGTALVCNDDQWINIPMTLSDPEDENLSYAMVSTHVPDADPMDNQLSCCFELYPEQSMRGSAVNVTVGPITDAWRAEDENGELSFQSEGPLTQAIRDDTWSFRNVVLDYPDQTIHLTPNAEVPYLDGVVTLTRLEVSPLGITARVEGDPCTRLNKPEEGEPAFPGASGTSVEVGDVVVTFGKGPADPNREQEELLRDRINALEVSAHMRGGSVQTTKQFSYDFSGRQGEDGSAPYLERQLYYPSEQPGLDQVIDPAQVDYVTVCGVDIPMPEPEPEPPAEEPVSIWQQIFRQYWK